MRQKHAVARYALDYTKINTPREPDVNHRTGCTYTVPGSWGLQSPYSCTYAAVLHTASLCHMDSSHVFQNTTETGNA